ncbi:MAG: hypothetical protein ACWGQW_22305 [bacterium]
MVEEKTEVTEVQLTDEERAALSGYGASVEQQKGALAELRLQYLRSEARVLQAITKTESDYMEHLQRLAKEKGLDVEHQAWQYDAQTGVFRRR